jgi:anti-sigma regulatory factor (Ser/Thr protein kinase)
MKMFESPVVVVIPGEREALRILRLVAMDVGRLLGFGYDKIEDARLAVHEAAAVLVEAGSDSITCQITAEDGSMAIAMSSLPAPSTWPPDDWEGSLGHLVLSHLADSLKMDATPSISFAITPIRA